MYLALMELILIGCEAPRRWRPIPHHSNALGIEVALILGGFSQARNRL